MNILLLSFSLQTLAAPDRWFSADKAQHFFMGAFVQGASFGILRATNLGKTESLLAASGVSVAASIGKELRDRTRDRRGAEAEAAAEGGRFGNRRGTVSVKDAAWGLAGAAAISPVLARTK